MKACSQCKSSFQIHPDEIVFLEKMDFKYGNKSFRIPEPSLCPDCRCQERVIYRNEQYLYHRKSDLSSKQVISLYSKGAPWGQPYTVYSQDEWNSDDWDAMTYGRDFDFSRPFFDQVAELHRAVPRMALISIGNENSAFTTGTGYCKNCYLINSSEYAEDCYYGKLLQHSKSSVDCSYLYNSELCYECFSVYGSYNCVHLYYSKDCSDCHFSENLSGCKNCFLCTDLKNKEYYFMNEPLDKEEYKKRVAEFMGSHRNFEKAKEILNDLRKKRVHKYANIVASENCTGDFIQSSKNCQDCYDVSDSEDCRYVTVGAEVKDLYDCCNTYIKPELCYQIMGAIDAYHAAFSNYVFHSQNVLYSEHIYNSKDIFACAGLKRKQYCILNKQYTKEEYEKLVPQIIEHMKKTGEWGQFFPPKYSPYGYNESLASEYFPLSKEEVLERGWNWQEDDGASGYKEDDYEFPNHIKDVEDDVMQKILKCTVSGKLYKIMPQELAFYRKMNLPLPRICPDQRHKERMALRNPRKLWDRQCEKCGSDIKSTYLPGQSEKVYCEQCYLKEVY